MPDLDCRNNSRPRGITLLRRGLGIASAIVLAAGGTCGLGGCQDSFLDPSVTGRWENTPTIVPVLDRIATIEDDSDNTVDYSEPVPEDLIPQAFVYRITPGDALEVTLYDLIVTDKADVYQVVVDSKGMIDIPQLGRIGMGGKTSQEAVAELQRLMMRLVSNPLAQVNVINQRGDTYSIVGNVERAGTYVIPNSNYHLLEALTSGGRFQEDVEDIFIIRRISLEDTAAIDPAASPMDRSPTLPPFTPPGTAPVTPPASSEDLLKVIDEVTGPATKPDASPAVFASATRPSRAAPQRAAQPANEPESFDTTQPATQEIDPPIDLPGDDSPAPITPAPAPSRIPAPVPTPPASQGIPVPAPLPTARPAPMIDLADSQAPAVISPRTTPVATASAAGRWVFLDGKWVQVAPSAPAGQTQPPAAAADASMTQRVIRVPTKELLAGKQKFNIVIRPGDVIRVPAPPSGLVYMAGQVNRPGPITLPPNGGLTLLRALDSSGGLSSIAIPERVDLTRMIGRDRQATIRLDVRAISEQTQPDIFLKANDRINVGTSFWALPVAVIRNGFRVNYGFGFLLDRNFGNDVFGPPPESARNFN